MTTDATVTNPEPTAEEPADQPGPVAAPSTWPSPITRARADAVGRAAMTALTGAARAGARAARGTGQAIRAVPRGLRLFFGAGILLLLGVVGAVALHDSLGLICIVVVIPICAATLGALGFRWYSGHATEIAPRSEPAGLQRSVEYVDKKLALALSSFGTEQHQQAVIALFQAKAAVELTLGTDTADYPDATLAAAEHSMRPRIRAGSTSLLRESNSLAAS